MISLNDVSVSYTANKAVLEQVSFSLEQGEIGCLLGPSGCGKTTLLRAIAGFHQPRGGEIIIAGQCVGSAKHNTPATERQIGMVFQDYALFPHMSVADNIGFGLAAMNKLDKRARIKECLALVELAAFADKFPHQLSGGQQQRVALARAIAPQPAIILLDEPFSSLDVELREQLAMTVRQLLKQVNITAIVVTHDQQEAFAMADKIAVLEGGKLQQWGSAYDLYHRPATAFVAKFIGESVFLPAAKRDDASLHTVIGDFDASKAHFSDTADLKNQEYFSLLVRPDDIEHHDASPFKARIIKRVFRGSHILYTLELIESNTHYPQRLLCLTPSHHDHQVGENFGIRLQLDHMIVFPFTDLDR
ncbi:MAG: ABC transporter ATP-binding protein [Paraglaciecola sp.]|uniref:ABC transporter ATP-binding protein n=1 Tax=Paraglaciecola sp. TaxID=1920173 RepID=UPI00273D7AD2|nr:ABC transporter ATP-binding protein [Paraglaciecola sp.]MDP5032098.1 ABC transporter ATP-binding protein [Paraglaciecola sp.]MDP5133487.1 ABC transporter ATP-binding protein [Paraglaciecola sp.]